MKFKFFNFKFMHVFATLLGCRSFTEYENKDANAYQIELNHTSQLASIEQAMAFNRTGSSHGRVVECGAC